MEPASSTCAEAVRCARRLMGTLSQTLEATSDAPELGNDLFELCLILNRFNLNLCKKTYATTSPSSPTDPWKDSAQTAFLLLTEGLSKTLSDLEHALRVDQTGKTSTVSWSIDVPEGPSIEETRTLLRYFKFTIQTLSASMEKRAGAHADQASPSHLRGTWRDSLTQTVFPQPESRAFESNNTNLAVLGPATARLQAFLLRFFQGLQPALPQQRPSNVLHNAHTDDAAEIGDDIRRKLERRAKQVLSGHRAALWKIRHALYWLSIAVWKLDNLSSNPKLDVRLSSSGAGKVGPEVDTLVDIVKSAWLIVDVPSLKDFRSMPKELKDVVDHLHEETMICVDKLYANWPISIQYDVLEDSGNFRLHMQGEAQSVTEGKPLSLLASKFPPTSVSWSSSESRDASEPKTSFKQLSSKPIASRGNLDGVTAPRSALSEDESQLTMMANGTLVSKLNLSRSPNSITAPQKSGPKIQPIVSAQVRSVEVKKPQQSTSSVGTMPDISSKIPLRWSTRRFKYPNPPRQRQSVDSHFAQQGQSGRSPIAPESEDRNPSHQIPRSMNFTSVQSAFYSAESVLPVITTDSASYHSGASDSTNQDTPSSGSGSELWLAGSALHVAQLELSDRSQQGTENEVNQTQREPPILENGGQHHQISYEPESLPREAELHNIENMDAADAEEKGFTRVSTLDLTSTQDEQYLPSRVRVFKGQNVYGVIYLRLSISRVGHIPKELRVGIQNADMVPAYAFSDDHSRSAYLYLREAGIKTGMTYKFELQDDQNTSELYGFQSVLTGALFEEEYPIARLMFKPRRSEVEYAQSTRIQIWTDAPSQFLTNIHNATTPSLAAIPTVPTKLGSRHSILDMNHDLVDATKIIFYMLHNIYVLIISDRFEIQPIQDSGGLTSGPTALKILPKKRDGVEWLRIRIIHGTRADPAGIPLDQAGMRFADQKSDALFSDYQSVRIDFNSHDDFMAFQGDLKHHLFGWNNRCAPFQQFRRDQRKLQVSVVQKKKTL